VFLNIGIFEQLEVCSGKTENDFGPTPEMTAKINSLPYPELHQDVSEMQFYCYLRDMLKVAGYANFSWRDLHNPTPKRLQYQLSAIFNLAKHREDQLLLYKELNEPVSVV
jgi:Nuf2 family